MPRPPTNLPVYNMPNPGADVCKMDPMMKKKDPQCIVLFLPILSAGYDTTAAPTAQAIRNVNVIYLFINESLIYVF